MYILCTVLTVVISKRTINTYIDTVVIAFCGPINHSHVIIVSSSDIYNFVFIHNITVDFIWFNVYRDNVKISLGPSVNFDHR